MADATQAAFSSADAAPFGLWGRRTPPSSKCSLSINWHAIRFGRLRDAGGVAASTAPRAASAAAGNAPSREAGPLVQVVNFGSVETVEPDGIHAVGVPVFALGDFKMTNKPDPKGTSKNPAE